MGTEVKNGVSFELLPGEEILWQEKIQHFRYFDGLDGKKAKKNLILSVCIVLALLIVYLVAAPVVEGKIVAILCVVLLVVAFLPVLRYKGMLKKEYYVTNKRVVVWNGRDIAAAMELKDVDAMQVFLRQGDAGCLSLGSAVVAEQEKQLRWRSGMPLADESHEAGKNALGMVLYSVAHVDAAVTAIEKAKQ